MSILFKKILLADLLKNKLEVTSTLIKSLPAEKGFTHVSSGFTCIYHYKMQGHSGLFGFTISEEENSLIILTPGGFSGSSCTHNQDSDLFSVTPGVPNFKLPNLTIGSYLAGLQLVDVL